MKSSPTEQSSNGNESPTQILTEVQPSTEVSPQPSVTTEIALAWWMLLPSNWRRPAIALMLCFSGLVAAPVFTGLVPEFTSSAQVPVQQQLVSRADYEQLKVGMTITDAQAALGRAIEISRDATTATYRWTNGDGSQITAVFKGDRLTIKEQSGLK